MYTTGVAVGVAATSIAVAAAAAREYINAGVLMLLLLFVTSVAAFNGS